MRLPLVTRRAMVSLAAAGLVLSACGEAPTHAPEPKPEPTPEIVLEPGALTLAQLGEVASVKATAGSQTTTSPALRVVSESRWFDDLAVLDSAALASSQVKAAAPGTVRLQVSAFGLAPRELTVTVAPAAPYVRSVSAPSSLDPTVLVRVRGYRMGEVGEASIAWDGAPARVLSRDSATIVVSGPDASGAAGCVGNGTATLAMQAAGVPLRTVLQNRREISLAVGEYARLTEGQAACLRLAPAGSAEYAVAYVDTRAIRRAQRDGLESRVADSAFSVTAANWGTASGSRAGGPSAGSSPGPLAADFRGAARPGRTPGLSASPLTPRTAPWQVGDTFAYRPTGYAAAEAAEVVQVYGGRFVLAVMRRDRAYLTPEWKAEFDRSMRMMLDHGQPYLRRTVHPQDPESTPGTGQLVIVAANVPGAWGYAVGELVELRAEPRNVVHPATPYVVAHEIAHLYQMRLRRATQCGPGEGCSFGFNQWGLEGGADFLAHEIIRVANGFAFDGNSTFPGGNADLERVRFESGSVQGRFGEGYNQTASFFRHLVYRLVGAGLGYDAAVREVMAGAMEGWDRFDRAGFPTTGTTARMRAHLGTAWTPEDAILLWSLAMWADDWTGNPLLQVPTVKYALGSPTLRHTAWLLLNGRLAGGGRARVTTSQPSAGNHGLFAVTDENLGGSYTFTSTAPETAWMIARIR